MHLTWSYLNRSSPHTHESKKDGQTESTQWLFHRKKRGEHEECDDDGDDDVDDGGYDDNGEVIRKIFLLPLPTT